MKRSLVLLLCIGLVGCANSTLLNQASDTTPPYINLTNDVFTTKVGYPINFSNITAYDEVDGLLAVMVNGHINYFEPGTYYPLLQTADSSGNVASVPITVKVEKSEYMTPKDSHIIVKEEEACVLPEARDASLPCDAISKEDSETYLILFKGEDGKERCEGQAAENGACEIIENNVGEFWGYGYIEKEIEEEKEEEE